MIDVNYFLIKLDWLKRHLNYCIDRGLPLNTFEEYYEKRQIEIQIAEINKPLEKKKSIIKISDHAYQRAKERLSLNSAALERLSEKAYYEGLCHSESKGHLRKYVNKIYLKYQTANNVRLYGENVYLFKRNLLITVYQLPNNLRAINKKLQAN